LNTGQVGSSAIVTPSISTTYTVTIDFTGGCTITSTIAVTVGGNTNITVAGGNICNGSSVELIASGGTSYTWINELGTGNSKTVSPSVNTTYMVTGNDAGGCVGTAIAIVTVNPLPTITVMNATICNGVEVILTASGGSTYTWMEY